MSDRNVIAAENYRMYRGKPLVRKDRQLCYGSMEDKYVLKLEIMSTKKMGAKEVPDQVMVGIASTADGTIVKFGIKNGLYEAFEYGLIWLDSELKKA